MSGWQPIETAPKDRRILLYGHIDPNAPFDGLIWTAPRPFSGYWDEIDEAWCCDGSTWKGPFMKVTHWMPLPEPPEAAMEAKE